MATTSAPPPAAPLPYLDLLFPPLPPGGGSSQKGLGGPHPSPGGQGQPAGCPIPQPLPPGSVVPGQGARRQGFRSPHLPGKPGRTSVFHFFPVTEPVTAEMESKAEERRPCAPKSHHWSLHWFLTSLAPGTPSPPWAAPAVRRFPGLGRSACTPQGGQRPEPGRLAAQRGLLLSTPRRFHSQS